MKRKQTWKSGIRVGLWLGFGKALLAQDPINQALTKVENQALTWANILVVLGLMALGGKYVFDSRHGHGDSMGTVIGCTLLIGARAAAQLYFGAV